MEPIHLSLPLDREITRSLRAGDNVLLSGELITGRDAAHKRLITLIEKGKPLPLDLNGQTIYYVGPAPAKEGYAVGSAGPTSSGRVDRYTPALLERGLIGMIGKGKRSDAVIEAMKQHGAVYFGAVGGAAALISRCIKKSEIIAYDDLGTEAIHRLTVEDFPVTVIIDSLGKNLYETEPPKYHIG